MAEETTGEALRRLAERAGLKGMRLAEACGWKTRSGPQPYLEGDRPLSLPIAKRFAQGLVGKGQPPISVDEVWGLAELPEPIRATDERPWLPKPETLDELLTAAAQTAPAILSSEDGIHALAHALFEALEFLAEKPTKENSADYREGAASVISLGLRDYRSPPSPSASRKPDHKAHNSSNKT